jgi:hypothetical protein
MRRAVAGWRGWVAGLALLATVLSGCTSARSSLGTSDDSCYLALPTAAAAVGKGSHMVGLHLFSLKVLKQKAPRMYADVSGGQSASQNVCVIAFTGKFTAGAVSKPKGRPQGHFAVVVATTPANQLLGTVIFRRVPLHFGHTHIG